LTRPWTKEIRGKELTRTESRAANGTKGLIYGKGKYKGEGTNASPAGNDAKGDSRVLGKRNTLRVTLKKGKRLIWKGPQKGPGEKNFGFGLTTVKRGAKSIIWALFSTDL